MSLLDLIFPRRCLGCGRWGRYFCTKCKSSLVFMDNHICPVCTAPSVGGLSHPRCQSRYSLDGVISIFVYRGVVKSAIKKIKYQFVSDIAQEFIRLIPGEILSDLFFYKYINKNSVMAPVPLHRKRLLWRGFNQAELLGRLLAESLNIGFQKNILLRTKQTKQQVDLTGEDRQRNVLSAFAVNPRNESFVQGKEFIIFDDVWTTGATIRNCANILKRTGAKSVWALTLAHG